MVGSRNPQRLVPHHAVPADEDVLQREHHRMADVQLPRCVGRRHRDREGLLAGSRIGPKEALRLPLLGDLGFKGLRIVGFG